MEFDTHSCSKALQVIILKLATFKIFDKYEKQFFHLYASELIKHKEKNSN